MKYIQKNYFLIIPIFIFSLFILSCNSDDDDPSINYDETRGLIKIQDIYDDNYIISLYTHTGKLVTGYNEIFLQVKNKISGELEKNPVLAWHPIMNMSSKSHSCPYSPIKKAEGKEALFQGFIIFQMGSNDSEHWELSLDYNISGQTRQVTENITVINSERRNIQSFTGADNTQYIAALVQPSLPLVGPNEISAYLYKISNTNTFIPVKDYTVKIDPRMPGMNNHSSPNNIDLTHQNDGFYRGRVSLTMTGYWKINLIILNDKGQEIKGDPITETNQSSSIFWEIEF